VVVLVVVAPTVQVELVAVVLVVLVVQEAARLEVSARTEPRTRVAVQEAVPTMLVAQAVQVLSSFGNRKPSRAQPH